MKPLVLNDKLEAQLKARIAELELIHNLGDATYTDTFDLNELKHRLEYAWRVYEGGNQPKRAKKGA